MKKAQIAILASGSGSNAEALWQRFDADHPFAEIAFIGCNRPPDRAGIYERAAKAGHVVERFTRADLEGGGLKHRLQALSVEWILLAGFLMRIPPSLVSAFQGQILNIHPALLPRFGGRGMWGMHVHEAVHAAALADSDLRESGMTVHEVNEAYDEGDIVFQAAVAIDPHTDEPEDIARKVLALEHRYYPEVAESLIADGRNDLTPLR